MEGVRHLGAQESPGRGLRTAGEEGFNKQLAEYVRTEFPEISSQIDGFTCFPANLEEVLDKADAGDMAEFIVFERLRGAASIPGLSITLFHGRSYAGHKSHDEGLIPREVDFAAFLRYKGRSKILMLEVKGSTDKSKPSSLSKTRAHAMSQLTAHREIFGHEHTIPSSVLELVTSYVAWPQLSGIESCDTCSEGHPRFQAKPQTCKQRGNNNPAIQANHLFSEKLSNSDVFNAWFIKFLDCEDGGVSEKIWTNFLNIFLLLSVGCLYDELENTFILLNKKQYNLQLRPRQSMSRPLFIYGPAGSGKTLSVLAMMERLHKKGEISEKRQVLYVCDNPEVHLYVRLELKKQSIPLDRIHFKRLIEIKGYPNPADMFPSLIATYDSIFVDEAEDLGIGNLNKATSLNIPTEKHGYFWILFDHLQESTENSGVYISSSPNHKSWDTVRMTNIYRGSVKCTNFLRHDRLISMYRPETKAGHKIEGPDIKVVNKSVKNKKALKRENVRNFILDNIVDEVLELTTKQGVHPGDIAVTFDKHDYETLFDLSEESLHKKLNELSAAKFEPSKDCHNQIPLSSSRTKDTMLYSHIPERAVGKEELFAHSPKLTDCRCKYFIGPYKKLKGLTVKVVIYVSVQGRTQGHNRKAAYTAISRSSCALIMFNISVNSMTMESYQADKVKFYREAFNDEGWARQNDFSLLASLKKQNGKKTCPQDSPVVYMTREGNSRELGNVFSVPSALGDGMGVKSTTESFGKVSTLCRVPDGVEEEWLEEGMLPASAYSQSLGGASFVPGLGRYTIPTNPQDRKKGEKKSSQRLKMPEELRILETFDETDILRHRKIKDPNAKSYQSSQMAEELEALDKRTDIPRHRLGLMRGSIIQSYM